LEFVEEALACRQLATVTLMKSLQEAISSHQGRSEYLTLALSGQKSNEGKKKKKSCILSLLLLCT
jgi:E3 ubiquitin-protein ligase BRE1